jgi:hypothetical protein
MRKRALRTVSYFAPGTVIRNLTVATDFYGIKAGTSMLTGE